MPVYTNIFAPPMPQPRRFVELGKTIRRLVESWPSDQRVAIIGTGHLSLELGGPRQFGPHGPDPEFDRKAVEWIASGDLDSALAEVSLDSLWQPGNATHGFMDFMLMMGVAGRERQGRLRRLARPVPHHGGLLHLVPERRRTRMSKYLLNKFLYTIDRDPELVERYRAGPARHRGLVGGRAGQRDPQLPRAPSASTWLTFTDAEREALASHDYVTLFELGAHNFLTLTLFIALFERDYAEPLAFQREYAARLSHWSLPYPDIST